MDDELGPDPEHPPITPEEDRVQRGTDPPDPVGTDPRRPPLPDPDPRWQPDPDRIHVLRGLIGELGKEKRPHREDVYPYLLIRALASGDRAKRPTWPPVPCWESPDILLIDASWSGPFDPSRLVASPTAGRAYRVFVRLWNLGLVPAVGVHVKAWAINPGFFGTGNQDDPYYQQNIIGGAWTELADRTRPGCVAVVELDQHWKPDPADIGHHCLLAEVSCPLDPAGGLLLSNLDRHVGQRNLEVLAGAAPIAPMFALLGRQVPDGFVLELTHAGPNARGMLEAVGAGHTVKGDRRPRKLVVPELDEIREGVPMSTAVHLLTAFSEEGRSVVVSSERLARAAGISPEGKETHPFERPGATRRLLDRLGRDSWEQLGVVTDAPMDEALPQGVAKALDLGELTGAGMAKRLGGPAVALHTLRFALLDREGTLVGGYTVVVGG